MTGIKLQADARKIITAAIIEYAKKHKAASRKDFFVPAMEKMQLTKEQLADKTGNGVYSICRSLIGSIINELINARVIIIGDDSVVQVKSMSSKAITDTAIDESRSKVLEFLSQKYLTEDERKDKNAASKYTTLKSIIHDKNNAAELNKPFEQSVEFVEAKFIKAAKIETDSGAEFPNTPVGTLLRSQNEKYRQYIAKKIDKDSYTKQLAEAVTGIIHVMGGAFFEKLSLDLIKAIYGEHIVPESDKVVGGSNDHGIDAELTVADSLGFQDKIVIQSKLGGNGSSGEKAIREFMGSMQFANAQKGIFISASAIEAKTKDFVKSTSRTARRLILIDKKELLVKMEEYGVGIIKDKGGNACIRNEYFIIQ